MTDRAALREQAKSFATSTVGPILAEHWPEGTFPIDPVTIARRMGLEVVTTPLELPVWGTLLGDAHGATIHADGARPDRVARVVAHELGHYCDLRAQGVEVFSVVDRTPDTPQVSPPDCLRAFIFDLELRIPQAALFERTGPGGRTPEDIARELGVTPAEVTQQTQLYRREHVDRRIEASLAQLDERRRAGTHPPADWW